MEGVRQGDDFRFQCFKLFKNTLSVLAGVRQGDDFRFHGFKLKNPDLSWKEIILDSMYLDCV